MASQDSSDILYLYSSYAQEVGVVTYWWVWSKNCARTVRTFFSPLLTQPPPPPPIPKSCLRPCNTLYFYIDEHVMVIPDNSSGSTMRTMQYLRLNLLVLTSQNGIIVRMSKFTNPELAVHLSVEGEEVNNIRNLIHYSSKEVKELII